MRNCTKSQCAEKQLLHLNHRFSYRTQTPIKTLKWAFESVWSRFKAPVCRSDILFLHWNAIYLECCGAHDDLGLRRFDPCGILVDSLFRSCCQPAETTCQRGLSQSSTFPLGGFPTLRSQIERKKVANCAAWAHRNRPSRNGWKI